MPPQASPPPWTPAHPRYGGARKASHPDFSGRDPAARPRYGDDRRAWHPDFVEYMYAIIEDPEYAGMPYALDDEGKTDWIIPSNRPRGSKNWDGNSRRREWWREKADALGFANQRHWLSKTAKSIHPFGERPCQICGRWVKLAYVYPREATLGKLNAHLPADAQLEEEGYLDIFEIADHFTNEVGVEAAIAAFIDVFRGFDVAEDATLAELADAIDEQLVQPERRSLSPGALANPPDRLDGFHTYNRCCRSVQDTGRNSENLRTYGVDRRAFEHWSEGEWNAANQLMKRVGIGTCGDCGSEMQLTADHLGPISLGFRHSPSFRAICGPCNSGRGNRMELADVEALIAQEAGGEVVISWQARAIWDACKHDVANDAQARLLSQLMRANQHHFLKKLSEAIDAGVPDVLLQFLSPEQAEYKVEFTNLDPATLTYDPPPVYVPRQPSYARSMGARMVRIAFSSLQEYANKSARKVYYVDDRIVRTASDAVMQTYERAVAGPGTFRDALISILDLQPVTSRDAPLAALFENGYQPPENFADVREALDAYQAALATVLTQRFREGRPDALGDIPLFEDE